MRRTALLGVVVATTAPLLWAGVAAADDPPAGSVSGVAWEDLNEDGRRQANEPALPDHWMYIKADGLMRSTVTDGQGRYRFSDLPAGQYVVTSDDRSRSGGLGLTLRTHDSRFDPVTRQSKPVEIKRTDTGFSHVTGLDAGLVTARGNLGVTQVLLEGHPDGHFRVGERVRLRIGVANLGNVADTVGVTVQLPWGLRAVGAGGSMRADVVADDKVWARTRTRVLPGPEEVVTIDVVADAPTSGEVRVGTAYNDYRDTNPANNRRTLPVAAS
ncbi:SdrD B-like domain-containing protein [Streptoalloteichus hindustanus]|uniref:SdrD B-like domain-containing protein n=1 Tax=Streptoalloteichus hindustanus TaxID=2017 RepID=UPI000937EA06|nr:SdrD B-like domain-containing protein [Streptoalloteichus hindustanus]